MNRPAIEIDVAVYGIIVVIGKPIRIPYKPFPFILICYFKEKGKNNKKKGGIQRGEHLRCSTISVPTKLAP